MRSPRGSTELAEIGGVSRFPLPCSPTAGGWLGQRPSYTRIRWGDAPGTRRQTSVTRYFATSPGKVARVGLRGVLSCTRMPLSPTK